MGALAPFAHGQARLPVEPMDTLVIDLEPLALDQDVQSQVDAIADSVIVVGQSPAVDIAIESSTTYRASTEHIHGLCGYDPLRALS